MFITSTDNCFNPLLIPRLNKPYRWLVVVGCELWIVLATWPLLASLKCSAEWGWCKFLVTKAFMVVPPWFTLANFLSSLTVTSFHSTDMSVCDMNVHATFACTFLRLLYKHEMDKLLISHTWFWPAGNWKWDDSGPWPVDWCIDLLTNINLSLLKKLRLVVLLTSLWNLWQHTAKSNKTILWAKLEMTSCSQNWEFSFKSKIWAYACPSAKHWAIKWSIWCHSYEKCFIPSN